ncbi:MAG TPA: DUF3363 domain-containing protein, partial [Rhodospirillales bacterium]|nr:DUF3363 domain-containing protein [Rhodospirillales bacterium]
ASGAPAGLRARELATAGERFAGERNAAVVPLHAGMQVEGRYAGRLDLDGGRYIAVERSNGIGFVRGDVPRGTAVGERISVTPRENDRAIIERDIERERDRDRGGPER